MAKNKQPITIQIYPRNEKGKTTYSQRFLHANGRIANDKYTRRSTAKEMAVHFTDKIKRGEYKIEVL